MRQLGPQYIGRILTGPLGNLIDFNGPDDPVYHNFTKGSENAIYDFSLNFYYNNGTKLIPYDFGARNHILKFEIECSLDKFATLKRNHEEPIELLPDPIDLPNLVPLNRLDNSQKITAIIAIVILVIGLGLLAFSGSQRTRLAKASPRA